MTPAERGRRGGRRTVERHGVEHMREIGALGFAALARRLGFAGGGRRGALGQLTRAGRLPAPPDLSEAELAALARECGME